MVSNVSPSRPQSAWRRSLLAARANLAPGVMLQLFAIAIALAYAFSPTARGALGHLADVKARYGYLYSAVATGLFGGLVPSLYLRLAPATRSSMKRSRALGPILFWTYKGLEVDALYRLQAILFGSGSDALTIASKVAVDQFVYNPIWAAPTTIVAYRIIDRGWWHKAAWPEGLRTLLLQELPATLVSTWSVWVPTVAVIYSLPSLLQVPLFNLALCFWVLVYTSLAKRP